MLLYHLVQDNESISERIINTTKLPKSNINSFIVDHSVFLDFGKVLLIIDDLFEENSESLLEDYIMNLDVNHQTAQQIVEFCFMNFTPYRYDFLFKMCEATNIDNKEFAQIYRNHYDNPNKKIDPFNITDGNYNTPTLHAFKILMEAYAQYSMDMIPTLITKKDFLEYTINEFVSDPFIRDYYLVRFYRILMIIMLDQNEVQECRRMANEILNLSLTLSPAFKIQAIHAIGMSYLYENYELGLDYLYKAKKLYTSSSISSDGDIHSSINLHQIYWGKEPEDLKFHSQKNSDILDVIYYHMLINDVNEAKKTMKQVNENTLSQRDSAFYFYVKGMLEDDMNYLYKSIMQFKQIGDKFYVQLPIKVLEKKGFNPLLIETILIR